MTASAVWLNGFGLDVKLVQLRVWKTESDTLLTSSVVFPVPGAEDFIVEPDRRRAAVATREAAQRTRAKKAVARIIDAGSLSAGTPLHACEYNELQALRAQVMAWIAEKPDRGVATWVVDRSRPLRWAIDGKQYSPTALIREIVYQATGQIAPAMYGTKWWADQSGRDLVALADLGVE